MSALKKMILGDWAIGARSQRQRQQSGARPLAALAAQLEDAPARKITAVEELFTAQGREPTRPRRTGKEINRRLDVSVNFP
jgi:hypothetical protein